LPRLLKKRDSKTKRAGAVGLRPSPDTIDFDYIGLLDFDVPMKGQQQRSIESRARIVSVACDAFMNQGYAAVSTHEVSAAAGVTQGLITYHFKTKEGLWQAAMDRVFGDLRNSLVGKMRSLQGVGDREFLAEVIRHLVHLELQFPSIFRFMVESSKTADDHLVWLLNRHVHPIYDVITHLFEVGQARGVLRSLPVTNAYYVLLTAGSIFSLVDEIRLVAGQDIKSRAFVEAHAKCLICMLMTDE
jgi:TetR/AcrR family transcriptional regulator